MRAGRPTYQPTDKDKTYVESLASYGVPEEDIARVVGVARSTLRKHYADQLDNGAIKKNAQVAGFLFTAAKKGSVPAMMFWLRCRAGWTDPSVAAAAIGKKEAAVAAARQPDIGSPFGRVIAARAERAIADVGPELPGLGRSADAWPVAHSRTAA